MIRTPKKKALLSDKITELLTVQPSDDIEDDHYFGSKPRILAREELASSDSEDAALSNFRKENVNLLSDVSKKYEGEVSKRELNDDSDSNSDALNEETEPGDIGKSSDQEHYSFASDSSSVSDNSDQGSAEGDLEENIEGFNPSQLDAIEDGTFKLMKEGNVAEEISKGNSVRNQLLIWENLLELRINFQKCLITANRMPMIETFKQLKQDGGEEYRKMVLTTENLIKTQLDKMLELQEILLKRNPETANLEHSTKNNISNSKIDDEIPSDTEPDNSDNEQPQKVTEESVTKKTSRKRKLLEYSEELAKRHAQYKPYRDSVIQKWNDKTRLAVANSKSAPLNSVLSQISYILTDKKKLVKRTQLKRSDYKIIGYTKPEKLTDVGDKNGPKDKKDDDEYIANIFDDDDFYHQLLREFIECKTADVSDPIQLGQQWVKLQQLKSKMKRKVDTKATKGRRIKYVVHHKLVNFMAPEKNLTWSDDSTIELYKSLFGKVFEQNLLCSENGTQENGLRLMLS